MASGKHSKKKGATAQTVVLIILIVIMLFLLLVWLLIKSYLGKINYEYENAGNVQTENSLTDEEILEQLRADEEITDESDSPQEVIDNLESQMQEHLDNQEPELFSSEDIYNILIIGCDSREEGGAGRSDAMILVSLNKETEKIHMASIMRDCYVSIPNKGNNRINAAYAFGGGSLLLDTIETNFGVEVDKYVAFDFYSFVDVVDSLGGIDITVSEEEMEVLNGYVRDLNVMNDRAVETYVLDEAGSVHLNGTQALAYSRIRHVGNGDFGRTERQRKVITKIFEKVKKMNLLKINELLNTFLPEIKTNLTEAEVMELLVDVMSYLEYDLDSLRIPVDGSYESMRVDQMAVLGIDLEKNHNALIDFITQ